MGDSVHERVAYLASFAGEGERVSLAWDLMRLASEMWAVAIESRSLRGIELAQEMVAEIRPEVLRVRPSLTFTGRPDQRAAALAASALWRALRDDVSVRIAEGWEYDG
jgi:hypothetical protein